jgi:hypothetical protein
MTCGYMADTWISRPFCQGNALFSSIMVVVSTEDKKRKWVYSDLPCGYDQ